MLFKKLLKRKEVFCLMLATAILCGIAPQTGLTMPVDSQLVVRDSAVKSVYLEKIQSFLSRGEVKCKLSSLGLSRKVLDNYLNTLDERKLQQLAERIDEVKSAGDPELILVLIVIFVVVAFFSLTDYALKSHRNSNKK